MKPPASTMPEAKFRSVKKEAPKAHSIPHSEFAHERRAQKRKNTLGTEDEFHAQLRADEKAKAIAVKATAVIESLDTAPIESKLEATPKAAKPKVAVKKKPGSKLAAWWPVGVGIFLAGFAPDWLSLAQQAGIGAVRLAFPLTLLAMHREIGIDAQMATMLPQAALFVQLPLEGLLTKLTLDRGKSLKAAAVQLLLVHAVSGFVLWLMTYLPK